MTRILQDEPRLLDIAHLGGSADVIERALGKASRAIETIARGDAAELRTLLSAVLHRVSVKPNGVSLEFQPHHLARWLLDEECAPAGPLAQTDPHVVETPMVLQRRGVEARFAIGDRSAAGASPDGNLTALIARAHRCLSLLTSGVQKSVSEVAGTESMPPSEVSRILPLAFLAPDIVQSILRGDQPVALTAERLKRSPSLPIDWTEQHKMLGMVPRAEQ